MVSYGYHDIHGVTGPGLLVHGRQTPARHLLVEPLVLQSLADEHNGKPWKMVKPMIYPVENGDLRMEHCDLTIENDDLTMEHRDLTIEKNDFTIGR